jgi:hypothetical protein
MANYAEYFELKAYKPKYEIGDRVFGYYEKIPFVGSVGNDTVISNEVGPQVSIHLDLPLQTKNGIRSIIIVKHKDIKRLVNYDEDSGISRKSTKSRK